MACTGDGGTWPSDGPYAPCARLLPLRRVRLVCSLPIPSLRSTAAAAQAERLSSATARAAPHQSCPFRPPQLTASLSILLQALPPSRAARACLSFPWQASSPRESLAGAPTELIGELRSTDSSPPLSLFLSPCMHLVRLASPVLVRLSLFPLLAGDGRPPLSRATAPPSPPAGPYQSSNGSTVRCTWLASLWGAQWCSPRGRRPRRPRAIAASGSSPSQVYDMRGLGSHCQS
jgi:hypothetical protein